jgi:hypothetical protein
MTKHGPSDRAWLVILLLYLCLIYPPLILSNTAAQLPFLKGDCQFYRAVIVSILEDGDLLLANNVSEPLSGQLALGTQGLVPKHPILMSLVSLPFYLLLEDKGLLLFNVLDCMILMVLIFKINRLFFDGYIAFAVTALYATGTLFFDYVYNYSPDVFSTVLVLSGLYFILKQRFYTGAFLLGLSVFAKVPNALLAALILAYATIKLLRGEKATTERAAGSLTSKAATITMAAAVFIVGLIPLAYTNYSLFGSPFITGYQRTAVAGHASAEILTINRATEFNRPLLKGGFVVLFNRYHGLIPTNPVLILAFLGLLPMRRNGNDNAFYLLLTICVVQFVLFSKYQEWNSSHFSNRYLMTLVAVSSVFTSSFLKYIKHKFFAEIVSYDVARFG